jgi:hypothetical protein
VQESDLSFRPRPWRRGHLRPAPDHLPARAGDRDEADRGEEGPGLPDAASAPGEVEGDGGAAQAEKKDEDAEEAEVVRGSCAAVRAAWTDDGLPPLAASGRKRHDRLRRRTASLDRVAALAEGLPGGLKRLQPLLRCGLEETAGVWPAVRAASTWVKCVARLLKTQEKLSAKDVRRRLVQLWGRRRQAAATAGASSVREGPRPFLKVSKSSWPGVFRCSDSSDLPRTNNDLEHAFGSHRSHERRARGRRRASPGWVVMGRRG